VVPGYGVTKIVTFIKSITAREIFKRCPQVKKKLWGGEFWTDGYFASTVGKHGDEQMIGKYVQNRGKAYRKLHADYQRALFRAKNAPLLAGGSLFSFIQEVN
jgi:putative transposase